MSIKYLVRGAMEWFYDESMSAVFKDRGRVKTVQKLSEFSDAEIIEMIGNFVYSETGDYEFAGGVVLELAFRMGLEEMLLLNDAALLEAFVKRVKNGSA